MDLRGGRRSERKSITTVQQKYFVVTSTMVGFVLSNTKRERKSYSIKGERVSY